MTAARDPLRDPLREALAAIRNEKELRGCLDRTYAHTMRRAELDVLIAIRRRKQDRAEIKKLQDALAKAEETQS